MKPKLLTVFALALFLAGFARKAKTALSNSNTTPEPTVNQNSRPLIYLNEDRLNLAKKEIESNNPIYIKAYQSVLESANVELTKEVDPVINKTIVPPSGDMQDYYSIHPYAWPNPNTEDGLPWIGKDGQLNPMTRGSDTDYTRLRNMFDSLETLALAHYFSGDEKYLKKAQEIVDTWFINPKTRVNPNIDYGQGVPGKIEGRMFGIIEFSHFGKVITILQLLERNGLWSLSNKSIMNQWLEEYYVWLTTSKFGIGERSRTNNHSSNYDYQILGIMIYLGKSDLANKLVEAAKTERIAVQIRADGSQPRELARTKSVNYTVNNLWALARVTDIGRRFTNIDLWNHQTAEGVSLKTGFDFVIPHLLGDKDWQWEQIQGGGALKQLDRMAVPMFTRTELMLGEDILPNQFDGTDQFSAKDILIYAPAK